MSDSDVVILFGGTSDERRVAVASAQHVTELLPDAELWFQAEDGSVTPASREALLAHRDPFTTGFSVPGSPRWRSLEEALEAPEAQGRTFFLALHGGEGEDGTVQRALEMRGLAFTGSGSRASATGFDKKKTKAMARAAGVRVVESRSLPLEDEAGTLAALQEMMERWGRLVAKPLRGGSSVGLHLLREPTSLPSVAAEIAKSGLPYLAEVFVSGRELTVGVVERDGQLRALPCSEVVVDPGRAFDYEGKYLAKGTVEVTPADLPPDVNRAAQEIAIGVHRALGCEGYSRTDVILGPEGPVMLEINTLPGLTRASFIPQQLAAEGTDIREFLLGQLALARARRDRRRS
jgi:D-alanine-D-alanine ligase